MGVTIALRLSPPACVCVCVCVCVVAYAHASASRRHNTFLRFFFLAPVLAHAFAIACARLSASSVCVQVCSAKRLSMHASHVHASHVHESHMLTSMKL